MRVAHYTEVEESAVEDGASRVTIRWLIGEADGAPNFAMRLFEIKPDGHTPRHAHPWEHEVYVLCGRGILWTSNGDVRIREGDAILVEENEEHQFLASDNQPVRFLCLVPRKAYAKA